MSFDILDKKVYTRNIDDSNNIKELELIKKYLDSQPDKINNLFNVSKTLNSTINDFIENTKNYSRQIELLAMKMIPNYSIEGQLIQAIQTFLLFYVEGMNNLASQLRVNLNTKQDEELIQVIDKFEVQKKLFALNIRNVNSSYRDFKREINLYQEYLVNMEYKEHEKKGISASTDDTISIDEIKEKEENDILANYNEEANFGCQLSDVDNKSELIKTNKEYIKYINESNSMLNKIKNFLSTQKTDILKSIYNICHHFGEGLLKNIMEIQKNSQNQTEVVDGLLNQLILAEKDKTTLTDTTIKLKYLEIYKNHILEKTDLQNKKNNDKNKDNNINKNNNNDTNTDINNNKDKKKEKKNDKKSKKIQKKRKNSLGEESHLTHKNDFIERKTIAISNKQLNNNYLRAPVNNPNQFNNLVEEEKEELFKSTVEKLNRDEIINIFEKIKNTNIEIDKSDIKLIEYEKNYKKIKEQLVIIFNYPEKYTEKDKNSLISFFEEDSNNILYFIKLLNDHRAKGKFFISELTFKYLGEIFKFLNNFILTKHNIELFKYILILSQTYYNSSEKDKKKIYLFSFIKDFPNYSNPQFWEDYLKELVYHDLKKAEKNDVNLDKLNLEKMSKGEKENLTNCFFSNLLTTTKAMADFNLEKQFVKDFVEKNRIKFFLSKEQVDNICLMFEMSYQENELNQKEKENKVEIKLDKCDKKDEKDKDNIKKYEIAKEVPQINNDNINIINENKDSEVEKTNPKEIEKSVNVNNIIENNKDLIDKNKINDEQNPEKDNGHQNKENKIITEQKISLTEDDTAIKNETNYENANKKEMEENKAKNDIEVKNKNLENDKDIKEGL